MTDVMQYGLPAAVDAERLVLGCMMLDASVTEVVAVLQPEDFHLTAHRRIYSAMLRLCERGETVDRVTVAHELQRVKQLESVGGVAYLVGLDDGLPRIYDLDSYVRIVKEKATLRRTVVACDALMKRCLLAGEDAVKVLDEGGRVLAALSDEQQPRGALRTPAEVIEQYPGGLQGFLSPYTADPGIPTPWTGLNRLIGGMKPGQLVLVAARPGVGKSAASMQVAEAAARRGTGVAVFSLEMAASEILQRQTVSRAGVNFQDFRLGRLDQDGRRAVQRAVSELAELPLWIDDSTGATVPAVHAAVRKLMARRKVGLVVVDYLQLMTTTGRAENRVNEVAQISRGLKLAARELRVPFLVMSQLSRESDRNGRRPKLTDLRDSGALEQDADVVMFLHPKEDGNPVATPTELILAKQRQGPRGKVDMLFLSSFLRFEEPTDLEPMDLEEVAA